MIKFGITGNIACGKSSAYETIKSAGYPVIDCDDIVKEIYKDDQVIGELSTKFHMIIVDKKIDIKKLSSLLFTDKKFKVEFENFIFPKVKEKIIEFFEKIFVIAPLLFEAGFENMFDKIILISSDENIRRERLIARNSVLSEIADKVIKVQTPEEEKIPLCDFVIKNNGTLEEFRNTVLKFLKN